MRKYLQRGLCFLLCIIMAFSFAMVPAGAIAIAPIISAAAPYVKEAVVGWLVGKVIDVTLQKLSDFKDGKSNDTDGLIVPISALDSSATSTQVTHSYLLELAYDWNKTCSDAVGFTTDVIEYHAKDGCVYGVIVARINRNIASKYLADGTGRILYCNLTEDTSGRWEPESEAMATRYLLPYIDLYNLANEVGGMLRLKDNFYEIYNRRGELYCNTAGYRFSSIYEPDQAAINQDRPTTGGTIIEGDTITNIENNDNSVTNNDYSQDIDIENMTQVLPGGTQNVIDNLIYDENNKTYYVDSHDVTNNITQNYLYEYHINYTSITYIGQTEEYNKKYELYYQLPDGRDSADLTVEDLEQLSTSFKDVVNYARFADDLSQRALYHFDGDTRDSSFWSYCSSLDWAEGASITYMDEGTFGGSLYLDETEHDFTLTLPANDAAGDFTLQFRYYQSHTEVPQKDSFLSIGGTTVLQFDGASYYDASGAVIAATSIGSWNELCLMREDGVLHYYINGVPYGSLSLAIGTSAVRFYFGADQQTYKKLDELRFTRGAIYEAGKGYTPSSVPYDSNLSLVLPFGSTVIPDEIMVFKPSVNNLFSGVSLADWTKSSAVGALKTYVPTTDFEIAYSQFQAAGVSLYRNPSYTTVRHDGDSTLILTSGITGLYHTVSGNVDRHYLTNGLYLPVCTTEHHYDSSNESSYFYGHTLYTPGQDYTLSVLLADGSFSYLTFRVIAHTDRSGSTYYSASVVNQSFSSVVHIDSCNLKLEHWVTNDNRHDYDDTYYITNYGFRICPSSAGSAADIIYMELVEGSAPEFSVSWEGAVYDPVALNESPLLAVRSNTPISSHQIGGVRPSYPEKGQVYAMVENGYISSLQQYTGSVWEAVDGRIWTGSRWIPASSYNVITLQDMYDIVDSTEDFEYIYTESGFWSWLQRAWNDLLSRLDLIVEGLGLSSSGSSCQHVYDSQVDKEASCTDPGHKVYTCSVCGHVYTELIDALGHDWVVTDRVDHKPLQPASFGGVAMYAARPSSIITQQPTSVVATVGTDAFFTVGVSGSDVTYQWQYSFDYTNWVDCGLVGNKTNKLTVPVIEARNGAYFRCLVSVNGSSEISNNAKLTVIDRPVVIITQQPKDVSAVVGDDVTFSVAALGDDLSYQWQYSFDNVGWVECGLDGNKTNTLTVPVIDARNGALFRCVITDAYGSSVETSAASLFVYLELGYDVLTCSRCGLTTKDYGDGPEELDTDVFEAAGDLIAEGITWLLDKATELVDALAGITDIFNRFVDRIGDLIGLYPAFLAAVFVLLPEDLTLVIWFGVIAFVLLAVWKKYNKS